MSEITIQEGNRLIGNFMGKDFKDPMNYMYDKSWDWLMPVCHKFDNLKEIHGSFSHYQSLCDEIDLAVSLYEIHGVWEAIVNAIQWYNTQTSIK